MPGVVLSPTCRQRVAGCHSMRIPVQHPKNLGRRPGERGAPGM